MLLSRFIASMSHVILNEWLSFYSAFLSGHPFHSAVLNIHQCGVPTVLFSCFMAHARWNCHCSGIRSVYAIQPCTSLHCHFMQSHICKVHVCLAVTCHLHFCRMTRTFFIAIVVMQGWNKYWNKSAQEVDHGEEYSPAAPVGIFHDLFHSFVQYSQLSGVPCLSSFSCTVLSGVLCLSLFSCTALSSVLCQPLREEHYK